MKTKILWLLSIVLIVSACKQPDPFAIPSDLEAKKKMLAEKQNEFFELKDFISVLQDSIKRQEPNKDKKGKLIATTKVTKKDFKHSIEVQSNVEAEETVFASSETGGRLTSLPIKEGQYVTKGQLIATLDTETMDKQIDEINTSLSLAKDVLARQERLWNQKIGTEMQYLQAKNNVEMLEKSLATLQSRIHKANAHAPISGVVERVMLKAGELAGPGTPIVQILNTSKINIVAQVPEIYTKSVRKGQRVKIVFPALDLTFMAPISLVGRTINPANRTFAVEVATHSRKGLIKPNLLATMHIQDKEIKDAIMVSVDLVREDLAGNNYIMVAKKDGTKYVAEKRIIQVGESYRGEIIITEGLTTDDILITEGSVNLVDGERIELN